MNRDFKGVWIPKEIWLCEKLNLQEKVLLVEINSLDQEDGCFASNKHFADFLGISKTQVSKYITKLEDKGLITRESFNGRRRVLRSNLEMAISGNDSTPLRKLKGSLKENESQDLRKRKGDNQQDVDDKDYNKQNKSSSSTNNNTNNKKTYKDDVNKIIKVYKEESSQHKALVNHGEPVIKRNKKFITRRLKDGYTVDQCIDAIKGVPEAYDSDRSWWSQQRKLETLFHTKEGEYIEQFAKWHRGEYTDSGLEDNSYDKSEDKDHVKTLN